MFDLDHQVMGLPSAIWLKAGWLATARSYESSPTGELLDSKSAKQCERDLDRLRARVIRAKCTTRAYTHQADLSASSFQILVFLNRQILAITIFVCLTSKSILV